MATMSLALPMQYPCTWAMTGLGAAHNLMISASFVRFVDMSDGARRTSALSTPPSSMSAPAENARPDPLITITPTPSSASAASTSANRPGHIVVVMAFSFSGLFSTIRRTRPV